MTTARSLLATERRAFLSALNSDVHLRDAKGVMSNADTDNVLSKRLADEVAAQTGNGVCAIKPKGQTLGKLFENHVREFLKSTFSQFGHVRPGPWNLIETSPEQAFARTEQYAHLGELESYVKASVAMQAALGNAYQITHDILILREAWSDKSINADGKALVDSSVGTRSALRKDCGARETLHASISCKWTLRSDRAQNARSEALNLIRNRKGQVPHIVVVIAEPMPSRIASLALGTGDIDCVYHFALPELEKAVAQFGNEDSQGLLRTMVDGRRLKDISDLPLDLAT